MSDFGAVLEAFLSPDGPTRNAAEAAIIKLKDTADVLAVNLAHVRAP